MEEVAVTMSLLRDLVNVIHTRADDNLVRLFIPASYTTGAVLFSCSALDPRETPKDNLQLFLVGVQFVPVLSGILFCPFAESLNLLLIGRSGFLRNGRNIISYRDIPVQSYFGPFL